MREEGLPESVRRMLQAMCQSAGLDPEAAFRIMADLEQQREQQMYTPLTEAQSQSYITDYAIPTCYPTPQSFCN